MEIVKLKDKRIGWIATIILHVVLIAVIFLSKGCGEIQTPPQFTLEEVITLDFTDRGGGQDGAPPKEVQKETNSSNDNEAVQEESPVDTEQSDSDSEAEENEEAEKPKYAGYTGSGDSNSGDGSGEGDGMGDGDGPNTGGGIGDGKGRQVIGEPELINLNNQWVGFVMVEFIIDRNGNTLSTRVLHPHPKTTITLLGSEKTFIEQDCKKKFKFTRSSAAKEKERVFKRMEYIKK